MIKDECLAPALGISMEKQGSFRCTLQRRQLVASSGQLLPHQDIIPDTPPPTFDTESHYVAQAILELTIVLPQPPEC
jgi:hypothetical protein